MERGYHRWRPTKALAPDRARRRWPACATSAWLASRNTGSASAQAARPWHSRP